MTSLDLLIEALPELTCQHAPSSQAYRYLDCSSREATLARFGEGAPQPSALAPFGVLSLPFHRMGAVDSTNLFGLDELILFSFYWHNRLRYRRAVDIGANIGLHSIVMAKCGFDVQAFEPDPVHFALLNDNLKRNACNRVNAVNAAVSSTPGEADFIRVLGNTTSSHLAGSKDSPYGELERFPVTLIALGPLMAGADLVKVDAEGHERQLVCATAAGDWVGTDMVLEIGTLANAEAIFRHATELNLKMFAQKMGWRQVRNVGDMPTSYHDGSVFISSETRGPWQ